MDTNIKSFFERLAAVVIFCFITALFFVGANYLYERQTPAYQAKKTLVDHKGNIKRVLFSPDDNPQEMLLGLIESEQEKISIATFAFTHSRIAQALIDAKKRGVIVEVVADGGNSLNEFSKISLLRDNAIPVWIYASDSHNEKRGNHVCNKGHAGIMHNKFMVFRRSILDRTVLWTGSYNFTRSANDRNQENIIVTDDADLIGCYIKHFEVLKTRCIRSGAIAR